MRIKDQIYVWSEFVRSTLMRSWGGGCRDEQRENYLNLHCEPWTQRWQIRTILIEPSPWERGNSRTPRDTAKFTTKTPFYCKCPNVFLIKPIDTPISVHIGGKKNYHENRHQPRVIINYILIRLIDLLIQFSAYTVHAWSRKDYTRILTLTAK